MRTRRERLASPPPIGGVGSYWRRITVHQPIDYSMNYQCGLLVEGFRGLAPDAWASRENAEGEVREAIDEGFCRAALDENGAVLGWVGGRHAYGKVWELHPLVVDPERQGEGIGRALVLDLRKFAGEPGAYSIQGKWDWNTVKASGSVRLHRLDDFKAAGLTPETQDKFIAGTGTVPIDLTASS